MLFRFFLGLALLTFVCSTPLERGSGPTVVDVPAGVFDEDVVQEKSPNADQEAEEIPVVVTRTETGDKDDSVEQVPQKEVDGTDFFGFRLPTLFVYRRPVIRDPFNSFPSFPYFNRRPDSDSASSFPSFQQTPNGAPERDPTFNVLNHMEAMMKRMQTQMQGLWGALLTPNFARPNFNRPPPPIFSNGFDKTEDKNPEVINIDNLPANYTNSTSETKEIDGQLVTVNKTIHRVTSNDSSGFFQFSVIKIRPQSFGLPTTAAPNDVAPTEVAHEVAGSVPSEVKTSSSSSPISSSTGEGVPTNTLPSTTAKTRTEDPSMNEIEGQPKSNNFAEADSFPFLLNRYETGFPRYTVSNLDDSEVTNEPEKENSNSRESVEELTIIPHDHPLQRLERKSNHYIDLSDDIRVNKVLEEQNRKAPLKMLNSDVELLIL